jgi:hypothetical protein
VRPQANTKLLCSSWKIEFLEFVNHSEVIEDTEYAQKYF